ncbi:uncharacterized protein TrAFT101_010466 [Trichoderma asperellum]|uniref:uncharacterized protein n=1 Tax=Trichoderma asperellum TaxID=101201 RepID=UPI00331757E1|nr:hypothetical protein TrAFT101_010466 [Trichoderma asperellum]
MSVASLQTATSPTCFLEQPANSSSSAPTKITLARATRRRVSSMKGLLPLTLSSASSCSSLNSQLPDGALEQRVDDYFPEVLARDLEISKPIFEAISMTAGPPMPPSSSSFNGYVDKPKTTTTSYRPTLSPYQSAHLRVQALGAIQERNSMVSFLDQRENDRLNDTTSDSCSATETDTSSIYSAEPPSFLIPHLSIDKKVSKLQLANAKPLSSHLSTIPQSEGSRHDSSWIEADSDAEDEYREDVGIYSTAPHLSPRPPTPPEFEASIGSISSGGSMHKLLHRKSHSVTGSSGFAPPPGQHLSNSTAQMWRPSSTQYPGQMRYPDSPESLYLPLPQYTPSIPPLQSPQYLPESGLSRRTSNTSIKRRAGSHATEVASMNYERATQEYNHFVSSIDSKNAPRYDGVYIRPSPPPSPLPSVQMWLNGSAQLFSLPFQSDELARVVPLPPDVMETLRVSTACFPETMLLSSSLTIETIRAYSRKARHPGSDTSPLPSPQLSATFSKQSLWRRVVKRGSQMSHKTRDPHVAGSGASVLQSPSSSSLESPKPWASIKNVFGNCSDYICDALYSHIVAYNYISALVARFPPSMGPGRSCSPIELQGDDIPKKAASLLGLNEASIVTSAAASVRSAKRNSYTHWGRDDARTASPVGTSASQDMAVRNIQTELLRCIRRLIATARLMSESTAAGEKMVEMDMEDADVLLMRSLCEIVRVNEEVAYIL